MTTQTPKHPIHSYDLHAVSSSEDTGWYTILTWAVDNVAQVTVTVYNQHPLVGAQIAFREMRNAQAGIREGKPLLLPHMGDFEIIYWTPD